MKKATGWDGIPACLLKESAAFITQTVTFLVNLSLTTGIVRDDWKQARVVHLQKSGGREGHEQLPTYLDPTSNFKNC